MSLHFFVRRQLKTNAKNQPPLCCHDEMKSSPAISAGNAAPFTAADVPTPVLKAVINPSIFKGQRFNRMGLKRAFFDVIVLKGGFELQDGELVPCSKKQVEPVWADEYWDEENSILAATNKIEEYKRSNFVANSL